MSSRVSDKARSSFRCDEKPSYQAMKIPEIVNELDIINNNFDCPLCDHPLTKQSLRLVCQQHNTSKFSYPHYDQHFHHNMNNGKLIRGIETMIHDDENFILSSYHGSIEQVILSWNGKQYFLPAIEINKLTYENVLNALILL